jgi:hypothetical protein
MIEMAGEVENILTVRHEHFVQRPDNFEDWLRYVDQHERNRLEDRRERDREQRLLEAPRRPANGEDD